MPPENETSWKRLGRLLAERRVQIASRYKNKNLFAEERQINRRMLWSIETGARDTYSSKTLRDIESSYMLAADSIERTLGGGELEPAPEPRAGGSMRPVPAAPPGSPAEEILASLLHRYLDDPVVQAIGAQRKRPRMVVEEILEWLDIQEERAGRRGSGTSAG